MSQRQKQNLSVSVLVHTVHVCSGHPGVNVRCEQPLSYLSDESVLIRVL